MKTDIYFNQCCNLPASIYDSLLQWLPAFCIFYFNMTL